LPIILGEKSEGERFAGAVATHCLEAMMQDGKAVQAGTSHYLGQNFAKASRIKFQDQNEEIQFAHTTSWGVSTRLIGSLIMVHGDDVGMKVPPRLAKYHVVILPSGVDSEERKAFIEKIEKSFEEKKYAGRDLAVHIDEREKNAGEKGWDWIRKGVPIRLEIGGREAKEGTITVRRRDEDPAEKLIVKADMIVPHVIETLGQIQENYYRKAQKFLDGHIRRDITTFEGIKEFFADPKNIGFVRAKWSGKLETEEMLKEYGVTIRCLPEDQTETEGTCVLTGEPATIDAIFGKSY
jgi:prolyl-tRNA synthetase